MGNRLPGVVASTSRTPGEVRRGVPNSVGSIFKLDHFLVTFYDEAGDEHVDVFLRIGDKLVASPFGEEWCATLSPVRSALQTEVIRRVDAREKGIAPAAVPAQDAVNVTGSRIAEETKKVLERS
jgi:hypothetical protein